MSLKFKELGLPGVFEITPFSSSDRRGSFVKVFEKDVLAARGLSVSFAEEYYSVSKKGVVRGMHFQEPPAQCDKLVYCVRGAVLDAALDIRKKSPSFGRHLLATLSSENMTALYLPAGIAHGFYALTDDAVMIYKVTSAYSAPMTRESCGIPAASHGRMARLPFPTGTPPSPGLTGTSRLSDAVFSSGFNLHSLL